MAAPKTNGTLKPKVSEMEIGDYIAATYTTTALTAIGSFSQIGNVPSDQPEFSSTNLTGTVYLMKIAKGILICTALNMSGTGITYNVLNKANMIAGHKVMIDDQAFLVRVPSVQELNIANSTIGGLMDTADRYTNFNTTSTTAELVQDLYTSGTAAGMYKWATTPGTSANGAAGACSAARFVLTYVDNPNSTDLFH